MNRKSQKQKRGVTRKFLAAMLTLMMLCSVIYSPSVFAAVNDSDASLVEQTEEGAEGGNVTDGSTETEVPSDEIPTDEVPADQVPADEIPADGNNAAADEGDLEEGSGTDVPETEVPQEPADDSEVEEEPAEEEIIPLADSEEDPNFIIVQKTFVGITEDLIPQNFKINVTNANTGSSYVLSKNSQGFQQISGEGNSIVWRWKIMNAEAGIYNVKEENANIPNYDVVVEGEGTIEVVAADMAVEVREHETTCSHKNWPVSEGTFFAATLTSGGIAVITEHSLSAPQRATVAKALVGKINGPWKDPVYFYSIDEQIKNGHGFVLNGATITYDFSKKEMIIGNTKDWQHVAKVWYDIQAAQNPSIGITNTYIPATVDINIAKQVTGNFGDQGKKFEFRVTSTEPMGEGTGYTLSNENKTAEFTLAHGENITLCNVKKGSTLTISETNAADYTTTVKVGGTELTRNEDGSYTYTIPSDVSETIQIEVENHKEIIIDTGVFLDSLPYILILAVVAVAAVVFVIRRHRKLS